MPKTVVKKFSFSELKIEKVKLFTQCSAKKFCISVFNVGGCLASCLTFKPFLTLDPQQLGCLLKKTCMSLSSTWNFKFKFEPNINNMVFSTFLVDKCTFKVLNVNS